MWDSRGKKILSDKKLDGILVSGGSNIHYLSGFRGGTGFLFLTKGRQVLLTDCRYTTQAKEEAPDFEVVEIGGAKGYDQYISDLIQECKAEQMGFEEECVTYGKMVLLKETCPKEIRWVPIGEALDNLRQVKTEEELGYLRRAEEIGDLAFTHILNVIKPGIMELEIAAELEYFMKSQGASGTSFDSIIASGLHSAMPHAMVSTKKVETGDFLTMDYGCIYEGYCSDMTRTIVVGKASEKQKDIYHIVLEAQLAALHMIKAGIYTDQVDEVARELIASAGYGAYFGHGLGHGVGLLIHENPRLSPGCHELLLENMIQTVEPGIYIPEFGGVRIEDMVVVKENGCDNLTHSPKELLEL